MLHIPGGRLACYLACLWSALNLRPAADRLEPAKLNQEDHLVAPNRHHSIHHSVHAFCLQGASSWVPGLSNVSLSKILAAQLTGAPGAIFSRTLGSLPCSTDGQVRWGSTVTYRL